MSNTPASDKRMSDACESPAGVQRSRVMDKESPNSVGPYDGSKEVFPLKETNYLKDACGQD